MNHADMAKRLITDHTKGVEWSDQLAEAQVHALLNIGEAIDAQTAELREVRGAINAQADHRTGVH